MPKIFWAENNGLWFYGPGFLQQETVVPRELPMPTDSEQKLKLKNNLSLLTNKHDSDDFLKKCVILLIILWN